MSRIGILCQYNKEADIYNLLLPLIREKQYKMISSEMLGKLMKKYVNKPSNVLVSVTSASLEEYENFFDEENLIIIGYQSLNSKVDVLLCYNRDMVELEELLLEEKMYYKDNFYTADKADYYADNEMRLLQLVNSVL